MWKSVLTRQERLKFLTKPMWRHNLEGKQENKQSKIDSTLKKKGDKYDVHQLRQHDFCSQKEPRHLLLWKLRHRGELRHIGEKDKWNVYFSSPFILISFILQQPQILKFLCHGKLISCRVKLISCHGMKLLAVLKTLYFPALWLFFFLILLWSYPKYEKKM